MPHFLCLLIAVVCMATCQVAKAETWQEFVRARAVEGQNDMEIRKALVRAGAVNNTVTQIVQKDAETVAWERAALAEVEGFVRVVTGNPSNALARVSGLSVPQIVAVVRQAKATAPPERRAEINDRSDALMVLFIGAREKGYTWPLPEDFGQESKTVVTQRVRAGRARWDTLKPVGHTGEAPSLDEIRKAMGRGAP